MDSIQPFCEAGSPSVLWHVVLCNCHFCLHIYLFFITQMVSLLQRSVCGTEELRWWGGCSYGSVLLWTLTVHIHTTKRGHVNYSKHVLMCELAGEKGSFSAWKCPRLQKLIIQSAACKLEPLFDTVYLYEWNMHVVLVLRKIFCLPPFCF